LLLGFYCMADLDSIREKRRQKLQNARKGYLKEVTSINAKAIKLLERLQKSTKLNKKNSDLIKKTISQIKEQKIIVIDESTAMEIPLHIEGTKPLRGRSGYSWVRCDKDGKGRIDFPTSCGYLSFEIKDNKVLVDRNGDGVIDRSDKKALEAKASFKVPVIIGGKKFEYPLEIQNIYKNRGLNLRGYVSLATQLGTGVSLRFLDSNLNGKFDDLGKDHILGQDQSYIPFGNTILIGNKLKIIEIIDNGKTLKLTPFTGKTANVLIEKSPTTTHLSAVLVDDNHNYFKVSSGTPCLMPSGKYKFSQLSGNFRMDGNAQAVNLGGLRGKEQVTLDIKPGENKFTFGPPFKLDFAVKTLAKNSKYSISSVYFVGANGEKYTARASMYSSQTKKRNASTLTCYARKGSKESEQLTKLEYG